MKLGAALTKLVHVKSNDFYYVPAKKDAIIQVNGEDASPRPPVHPSTKHHKNPRHRSTVHLQDALDLTNIEIKETDEIIELRLPNPVVGKEEDDFITNYLFCCRSTSEIRELREIHKLFEQHRHEMQQLYQEDIEKKHNKKDDVAGHFYVPHGISCVTTSTSETFKAYPTGVSHVIPYERESNKSQHVQELFDGIMAKIVGKFAKFMKHNLPKLYNENQSYGKGAENFIYPTPKQQQQSPDDDDDDSFWVAHKKILRSIYQQQQQSPDDDDDDSFWVAHQQILRSIYQQQQQSPDDDDDDSFWVAHQQFLRSISQQQQQQSPDDDDDDSCWVAHQQILRSIGLKDKSDEFTKSQIAFHTDDSDHPSLQPHIYFPMGGGEDGRGGYVSNTDLIIFNGKNGGVGYRAPTALRDTVIIALFNPVDQLHGTAEDDYDIVKEYDRTCWSLRYISYLRGPIMKLVEDCRKIGYNPMLQERKLYPPTLSHTPLDDDALFDGMEVSSYWDYKTGPRLYNATLYLGADGKRTLFWHAGGYNMDWKKDLYSPYCSLAKKGNDCPKCKWWFRKTNQKQNNNQNRRTRRKRKRRATDFLTYSQPQQQSNQNFRRTRRGRKRRATDFLTYY